MKLATLVPIAFLVLTSPVWLPFTLALASTLTPFGPGAALEPISAMAHRDASIQQFARHWWHDGFAGLSTGEAPSALANIMRLSLSLGGAASMVIMLLFVLAWAFSRPYNWLRPTDWPRWDVSPSTSFEPAHHEHIRWQPKPVAPSDSPLYTQLG
jgi:hypothetical protein